MCYRIKLQHRSQCPASTQRCRCNPSHSLSYKNKHNPTSQQFIYSTHLYGTICGNEPSDFFSNTAKPMTCFGWLINFGTENSHRNVAGRDTPRSGIGIRKSDEGLNSKLSQLNTVVSTLVSTWSVKKPPAAPSVVLLVLIVSPFVGTALLGLG
jgi:hypothetical protein